MVRWNSHARLYSFRLVFGKACSFHVYIVCLAAATGSPERSVARRTAAEAGIASTIEEWIISL